MGEPRRTTDAIDASALWPTVAVGGVLAALAALLGFNAGASPDNCGELPGITRAATIALASIVAAGIFVVGLVVAAMSRRAVWLGRAAILALAIASGVQLGASFAGDPRCDGEGGPIPRQPGPTALASSVAPAPGL